MIKTETKKGSNVAAVAFIGASLAGLAATAYFFFGPKGKTNQKHAKAWAIKMKGDVIEKLEMVRDISEPIYHEIIDSIAKEYEKGKKASREEINVLAKDLKKHWKTISKTAKKAKGETMEEAKPVKKATKK